MVLSKISEAIRTGTMMLLTVFHCKEHKNEMVRSKGGICHKTIQISFKEWGENKRGCGGVISCMR